MDKKQTTTWKGLVERNMDPGTITRMYCLANSEDEARKELERICKKHNPGTFYITITDITTYGRQKMKNKECIPWSFQPGNCWQMYLEFTKETYLERF